MHVYKWAMMYFIMQILRIKVSSPERSGTYFQSCTKFISTTKVVMLAFLKVEILDIITSVVLTLNTKFSLL